MRVKNIDCFNLMVVKANRQQNTKFLIPCHLFLLILYDNTDLINRLIGITDNERAAIREQFDTCIFVDETLNVTCTSDDPMAELALMGGDGTMYENGTASFMVTMGNFDTANTTFMCAITNAPGSCGGFVFQSSVIVYG
jgi:hypothetical protein